MDEQTEVAPVTEATANDFADEAQDTPEPEATEPETTEAPEKAADDDDGEEQQRKSRHQRRKEATERARKEAEEWREKAEAAAARLKEYEEAAGTSKPPQEGDFKTYEEYTAALAGWHAMQQLDARERSRIEREIKAHREAQQRAQQAQQAEIAQQWASQVEDAKSRYADFDRVALNPTVPITPQVAQIIQTMDAGADVAYHLGMNPAEAARISQLHPVQAAIELGRLEARVTAPKPRNATKAPDPLSPVKGRASASKDPAKMTAEEYDAWREAGGTFSL